MGVAEGMCPIYGVMVVIWSVLAGMRIYDGLYLSIPFLLFLPCIYVLFALYSILFILYCVCVYYAFCVVVVCICSFLLPYRSFLITFEKQSHN